MQVSVAAAAMPGFTPGTFATASPISRIAATRSGRRGQSRQRRDGIAAGLADRGQHSPVTQRLKRFAASFVLPRIKRRGPIC